MKEKKKMSDQKEAGVKDGKLTKLEKYWILYDVGNSAFVLLVATILPIYFNYLAGQGGLSDVDALAYWGYGVSISTLIVAVIGDRKSTRLNSSH